MANSAVFGGAASLQRTTFFAAGDPITVMVWAYPTTIPGAGAYENIFTAGPFAGANGMSFGLHASKWSIGTGAADFDGVSTAVANEWRHVGVTRLGNDKRLFVDGVQESPAASDAGTIGTTLYIGEDGAATSFWVGRLAALKIWKRVLSQAEFQQEMLQIEPVSWHLLWGFWPLDGTAAALVDDSNYGRTLSVKTGSITAGGGPPVPWIVIPRRRVIGKVAAAAAVLDGGLAQTIGTRALWVGISTVQQTAVRATSYLHLPGDASGPLPTQPDTWVQPLQGTRALSTQAVLRMVRAVREGGLWKPTPEDGPLPTQSDTYQAPTQGTLSLTTRAKQWWGRVVQQRPNWQPDTSTQPVVVEPDTWQQPTQGTRALAQGQRAWWQKATRPAPFGSHSDGPLATQADTYQPPTQGTRAVMGRVREWTKRAAGTLGWRFGVDSGPVVIPPTTGPVIGFALIILQARGQQVVVEQAQGLILTAAQDFVRALGVEQDCNFYATITQSVAFPEER